MEQLPPLREREIAIQIEIHPFLLEHAIQSTPILPAVQTMQILASEVKTRFPEYDAFQIKNARFNKVLVLSQEISKIDAILEIQQNSSTSISLSLATKIKSKSGITRKLQHASMEFSLDAVKSLHPQQNPFKGRETSIPLKDIYPGLIKFGPHFCNITKPVQVNPTGSFTSVSGGKPIPGPCILGSPFTLDSAFHAACAWGKHYKNRICYPVAFNQRIIHSPTQPETEYLTTSYFKGEDGKALVYNLYICDKEGDILETVLGLQMMEFGI